MITDHVFRRALYVRRRTGAIVPAGTCWYLTSCSRPASEHITPSEYRRRRQARPT